jgi:hypothetical protein
MYFASTYNSLSVPLNFQATGLYNLIGCFFCFSHIRCSLHLPLRFPFCLPRPHLSCFLSLYFSDIIIHIFQPLINLLILSLFHSPPHLPRTSPPHLPRTCCGFTVAPKQGGTISCLILATEINYSVVLLS